MQCLDEVAVHVLLSLAGPDRQDAEVQMKQLQQLALTRIHDRRQHHPVQQDEGNVKCPCTSRVDPLYVLVDRDIR